MRSRISILCLFVAWFCANGATWNLVQVVAWGKMFSDYAKVMPFDRALALTFDGSKPCDLCLIAQAGDDAGRERHSPATTGAEKLLLTCQPEVRFSLTAPAASWPAAPDAAGLVRTETVPVPPPRA